jgi:hypothetical protein
MPGNKLFAVASFFLFSAFSLSAQTQPVRPDPVLDGVIAKIITRENQEMTLIRQRSPVVETYIQKARSVENDGSWVPDGDHYFIGRADFAGGLGLAPISSRESNPLVHTASSLIHFFDFGDEFLPKGFLQMIYLDNGGLDTQNYAFDYVRREFLGEVRTLVFDVTPAKKSAKGRFIGRIWVEDQGFTIVRFNGSYSGHDFSHLKFHFDSWRVNAGPDLWLPAFIYSEQEAPRYSTFKAEIYKAQTRLWGYNAGKSRQEEELSQVLIESATPVIDNSAEPTDRSPLQQARAWDQQAQDNVIEKLQRDGLVAPKGEVDKILNTVVNNLEVAGNLDFDPEIQCRVLMTSTIESFSIGHTIVLSRGLIDVLPDEASLAAMLAKELGYILTDPQKVDTRYAFYDRLQFSENKAFQHFDFDRRPEADAAASAKAAEILKTSPYKDQLATAEMFMAELRDRSRQIPNLISARLGDAKLLQLPVSPKPDEAVASGHVVALPLGGRIKLNPWDDSLEMLKSTTAGTVENREKMPFEISPFVIYLTRVSAENPKSSQFLAPQRPGT